MICQGYHGAAVGKGRQLAKTELEKLKLSELSMREAVMEAARMYAMCHLCSCFRLNTSPQNIPRS
jgi:20S proteasome subunit alpha 7